MEKDINKIIAAELSGSITEADQRYLDEWLKDPENQRVYDRLKSFWPHRMPQEEYIKAQELSDQIWHKAVQPKPRIYYLNQLAKLAAILLIFLSIIFYLWKFPDQSGMHSKFVQPADMVEKTNVPGIKSKIFLPDGSSVNLNSESTIIYPEQFSDSVRMVEVHGEAFFDVKKEADRPFIVKSGDVSTQVLGTKFNVRAYPEEEDIQVSLLSGKVKVAKRSSLMTEEYMLLPGQFVNFESEQIITGNFDEEKVFGWKEGIIIFEKAGFNTIIKRLSRWYGVNFSYQGAVPDWSFNGKFVNENLENIMEILSHSEKFHYVIEGKTIKLKLNGT
ncbi:MAG: FecR family protein [Candidatus Cyclobacteriaceae bacterium M3_2C_046]